ncbi:MAG: polyprenyl synthetase family protein [Christensenellales bacterium]
MYQQKYKQYMESVEQALPGCIPDDIVEPLGSAMRYSLLHGGKRMRAVLCLAAAELAGGSPLDAMPFACALEMIHAYSLIHDDMPCMDDDDLRRGKPSNHIVFGEAMALLAGDGLLSAAFDVMLNAKSNVPDTAKCAAMKAVSCGAGVYGMVGGQCLDITSGDIIDPGILQNIHAGKTGAMVKASLLCGLLLFNPGKEELEAVETYGENIGLAFQIVDDLLDRTGDAAVVGKKTGKDADKGKMTFPAVYGLEQSRIIAAKCTNNAVKALEIFKEKAWFLKELAEAFLQRDR